MRRRVAPPEPLRDQVGDLGDVAADAVDEPGATAQDRMISVGVAPEVMGGDRTLRARRGHPAMMWRPSMDRPPHDPQVSAKT